MYNIESWLCGGWAGCSHQTWKSMDKWGGVVGDLTRRCGGTMLQTTWVVWGAVWGQKGLDWTNKVGKLVETD